MTAPLSDKKFVGYIPDVYDDYFVPLLFAPYADDLARRVPVDGIARVLELAAGTGVLTRALDAVLPANVSLAATDLNQPMLDKAKAIGTRRDVVWRQADAMTLPFEDESVDAVVCQFGVMFFPDKPRAFAEAFRVLKPRGVFVFNTWDRIEDNELSATVMDAMARLFPDNPAAFFARTPHGYFDKLQIANDLAAGGFNNTPRIVTVPLRARARSARDAAMGFCQGSPLRNEIEERSPGGLEAATDATAAAIAARFGRGAIDTKMQAHVVIIRK